MLEIIKIKYQISKNEHIFLVENILMKNSYLTYERDQRRSIFHIQFWNDDQFTILMQI